MPRPTSNLAGQGIPDRDTASGIHEFLGKGRTSREASLLLVTKGAPRTPGPGLLAQEGASALGLAQGQPHFNFSTAGGAGGAGEQPALTQWHNNTMTQCHNDTM